MNQFNKYIIIEVAFPGIFDSGYNYILESDNKTNLIGCRVLAPIKRQKITGIITDIIDEDSRQFDFKLKHIIELLDIKPIISKKMLQFLKWISEYYIAPFGECLKLALPSVLTLNSRKIIIPLKNNSSSSNLLSHEEKELYERILKVNKVSYNFFIKRESEQNKKALYRLIDMEYLKVAYGKDMKKVKPRKVLHIIKSRDFELNRNNYSPLEKKLKEFIKFIAMSEKPYSLSDFKKNGFSDSIIKKATERGIVCKIFIDTERVVSELKTTKEKIENINLNDEQRSAVSEIKKSIIKKEFNTFLLHGITGSGKTIVYIEVVKEVIARGRTAIILIPEISLTPQTVKRFKSYFDEKIAVLHSRLSAGEKFDSWKKINKGDIKLVIGPRSALFAPLKNIGVIVVDEEHESSYKQNEKVPNYHAGNISVIWAKINDAIVILGSATPSIETYYNAVSGKYKLLELKKRALNAAMPAVNITKLGSENKKIIFSEDIIKLMEDELANENQIIILQNRRGYASYLKCSSCNHIEFCPNCAVTMTYHLEKRELICHYCGYFEKARDYCGNCRESNIYFRGIGTEQVVEEIKRLFPQYVVLRMDQDTTSKKSSHMELLEMFGSKKAQILVGTQMIAKGLDFPDVTLVCMVNADTELVYPDFRSDEKAFQLMTQVAGRSGRSDKKGRVVIQTFMPENELFHDVINHDFISFYKSEIRDRKNSFYPPFSKLVKVQFSSKDVLKVKEVAERYYNILSGISDKIIVYPPMENMISKVKKYYRIVLIVKSTKKNDIAGKILRDAVRNSYNKIKKHVNNVKISIDVDPVSLL